MDRSDDKVRCEEGEKIVDEDGDDGLGDAARLDGIPMSVNRKDCSNNRDQSDLRTVKAPG